MPTPLISIIIPCYNMGDLLLETIRSVESVYIPGQHEVIVIDDGSTDEETIKNLGSINNHRVVRQQNSGVAHARNHGLHLAQGEYVIFLDADNLITDGYLTAGIAHMLQHPETDIVYGESKIFGASTGRLPTRPFNLQSLMTYNYIDTCCLVRKIVFDEIGGFDENMRDKTGIEDWEMWLRASFYGKKFHYLEGVVVQHYRLRKDSMMRDLNKNKIKRDEALSYLENKFPTFLNFTEVSDAFFEKFSRAPIGWTAKLFLKKYWPGRYRKLVMKGRLSKYL